LNCCPPAAEGSLQLELRPAQSMGSVTGTNRDITHAQVFYELKKNSLINHKAAKPVSPQSLQRMCRRC